MPTTTAYEWHRKAMAGENPAVTYEPQCGFYLKRDPPPLDPVTREPVGKGPFVPCSIWLEQPVDDETGELLGDEVLLCECGGVETDAAEAWSWLAKRPISKEEYDRRSAEMITGESIELPF